MNKLLVFQASAGSGKTFKLTENYLKLLFDKPDAYRRTLAVTFTNKATEEMKTRILLELHKLADNQKSDYIPIFCDENKLVEVASLRTQAKDILQHILHDYSRFKISTIDRFFQQIIRSFIREIGLNGNYMLELDNEKILTETVETIMLHLDEKKHKKLLDWLITLAEQRIEAGEKWQFKESILSLGRELFKENYLRFSNELEKITDKKYLSDYISTLVQVRDTAITLLQEKAKKALNLIQENGLQVVDFRKYTISKLEPFANGEMVDLTSTFLKLETDTSSYYTKTSKLQKEIIQLVENGLHDMILDFIASYNEQIILFNTADVIIKQSNILGIITDIHASIKENISENNALLLSDSNSLLHGIISDSDTPFIYEKIGTQIDHFLLDEFQDTSLLQWENFRPLIQNSLANGKNNLIVGDVKQSIYRWRNSDWKILAKQLNETFAGYIQQQSLQDNWRSDEKVIDFNNDFFVYAINTIQAQYNDGLSTANIDVDSNPLSNLLQDSYANVEQVFPEKKASRKEKGYVEISFGTSLDKDEYAEFALSNMIEHIERIQEAGFALRDIAVLTRTRSEGRAVAEYLLQYKNDIKASKDYKYDIISEESLNISNSKVVQFMLALLAYQLTPSDKINALKVVYLYNELMHPNDSIIEDYFDHTTNNEDTVYELFNENERAALQSSMHLPLYEMTEKLIELFTLNQYQEDIVYIQAFQDVVLDFIAQKGSDIPSFLHWWEETGKDKTVSTSDKQNAIRILTIHKSKGLDFGFVLIPFCNWNMDHKPTISPILWCRPTQAPFNTLPIVPLNYGSKLAKTHFFTDYFEEKLYAYMDNINTLYVAFTRAKYGIFISSMYKKESKDKKATELSTVGDILHQYVGTKNTDNSELYSFGKWERNTKKTVENTEQKDQLSRYFSSDPSSKVALKLHSPNFIGSHPNTEYGQLMHSILEKISTENDIPDILSLMRINGSMNENELTEINRLLKDFFSLPNVKNWFSGKYKSYNERSILTAQGRKYRPDKILTQGEKAIVIDYKFGEEKTASHEKQIKTYMNLLQQMNFTDISGHIYYGKTNTFYSYSLDTPYAL